jgi:hypothetical protein
MKRLIIAFFTLALISISARAQTPQTACRLSEAPTIRGIRLGMTTADLLALFPGSANKREIKEALDQAKTSPGETAQLVLIPANFQTGERFARVDSVTAYLSRGRLIGFGVAYIGPGSNGPVWPSVDEWIAKLAESFNLPGAQGWSTFSEETSGKVLKCSGFDIEASAIGGAGAISIRSTSGSMANENPSSAEQERKRREFKP